MFTTAISVLTFVIGIFVGRFVKTKPKVDGILGVDTRDQDRDYYDFVILTPTEEIPKKRYLTVEVKNK